MTNNASTTVSSQKPRFSLVRYIKNSIVELKKVTWPTKQAAMRSTGIVIVFSIMVALFLGVLDYMFNLGLDYLLTFQA